MQWMHGTSSSSRAEAYILLLQGRKEKKPSR